MSAEAKLLFLFLDGVGLGSSDPALNPFAAARTPVLANLVGGPLTAARAADGPGAFATLVFRQLDATLGVAGLPQSATGQSALLSGVNAAVHMGRHYGPWPGPTIKRLLDAGTLFDEVRAAGGSAALANVYPPPYFEARRKRPGRVNVPVYAAGRAGLPLFTLEDYRAGLGVSVDFEGAYLRRWLPEATDLSPAAQGRRLARTAAKYTLTFFDFWPSDHAGHRADFAEACALVERLDAFVGGVLDELGEVTLLVTSDHGNLEDKSVRGHTRAPVPLLALGPQAAAFADATTLLDVAPGVRRALGLSPRPEAAAR